MNTLQTSSIYRVLLLSYVLTRMVKGKNISVYRRKETRIRAVLVTSFSWILRRIGSRPDGKPVHRR